jgi:hypothetical protein
MSQPLGDGREFVDDVLDVLQGTVGAFGSVGPRRPRGLARRVVGIAVVSVTEVGGVVASGGTGPAGVIGL